MKHHIIVRKDTVTGQTQVCTGSSPISNKPYWGEPGAEPVIQPLTFRAESYAKWCLDLAVHGEEDAEDAAKWMYHLGTVDIELEPAPVTSNPDIAAILDEDMLADLRTIQHRLYDGTTLDYDGRRTLAFRLSQVLDAATEAAKD